MTRLLLPVLLACLLLPSVALACGRHHRPCGHGHWVRVWTTGYDERGKTACGPYAGPGIVAVDPRVFRCGQRFWIPRYGLAVAEDTGSAVRGLHLDLWLANPYLCDLWTGSRRVYVYG